MPIALIVGVVAAFLFLRKPRAMGVGAGTGMQVDEGLDSEEANLALADQLEDFDEGDLIFDPLESPLDQEPEDLAREVGLNQDQVADAVLFEPTKPSFDIQEGVFDAPIATVARGTIQRLT